MHTHDAVGMHKRLKAGRHVGRWEAHPAPMLLSAALTSTYATTAVAGAFQPPPAPHLAAPQPEKLQPPVHNLKPCAQRAPGQLGQARVTAGKGGGGAHRRFFPAGSGLLHSAGHPWLIESS